MAAPYSCDCWHVEIVREIPCTWLEAQRLEPKWVVSGCISMGSEGKRWHVWRVTGVTGVTGDKSETCHLCHLCHLGPSRTWVHPEYPAARGLAYCCIQQRMTTCDNYCDDLQLSQLVTEIICGTGRPSIRNLQRPHINLSRTPDGWVGARGGVNVRYHFGIKSQSQAQKTFE